MNTPNSTHSIEPQGRNTAGSASSADGSSVPDAPSQPPSVVVATYLVRARRERVVARLRPMRGDFHDRRSAVAHEKRGDQGPIIVFESGLGAEVSAWRQIVGPVSGFAQVDPLRSCRAREEHATGRTGPRDHGASRRRLARPTARAGRPAPTVHPRRPLARWSLRTDVRAPASKRSRRNGAARSASTEAPAELKTRAHLMPGSTDLEEEGVAESNREVRSAGPFPMIPLTVIAATDHGPYFHRWEPTLMELQEQLATLSPLGSLVIADGSGHDIAADRPALVVGAIRTMANALPRHVDHPIHLDSYAFPAR